MMEPDVTGRSPRNPVGIGGITVSGPLGIPAGTPMIGKKKPPIITPGANYPTYNPPAPVQSSGGGGGYVPPAPTSGYKPSQQLPSYITSDPMYKTPFTPGGTPPYQDVYDWGRGSDTSGFFTSNWNDPTTGMGYGDVNSKQGQAGLNYSFNAPKPWTPPPDYKPTTIPNRFLSGTF